MVTATIPAPARPYRMAHALRAAVLPAAMALLLAACSQPTDPDANRGAADVAGDESAPPPGSSSASLADAEKSSREKPALAIDAQGLRLFDRDTGAARPLSFGLGRAQLLSAMQFLGRPAESGTLPDCGPGPLDHESWRNGLTLYFQHNRFAGWAVRAPEDSAGQAPLATAAGIGLGSTRAQLESAYEVEVFDSSLGTEFAAGKLAGVLDGAGRQARITHLWAGDSCVMR